MLCPDGTVVDPAREDLKADRELEWWQIAPGNLVLQEEPGRRTYDLAERTTRFGEEIVRFAKQVPTSPVNNRLIGQLVGAGTSIGANYCEADEAVSRKDFMNRIGTCKKEARETQYFLRLIAIAEPELKDAARALWKEARELHLIFASIFRQR